MWDDLVFVREQGWNFSRRSAKEEARARLGLEAGWPFVPRPLEALSPPPHAGGPALSTRLAFRLYLATLYFPAPLLCATRFRT